MTSTAERLHHAYRGQDIDWPVVDRINQKIGGALNRPELVKILSEYEEEILNGGLNQ